MGKELSAIAAGDAATDLFAADRHGHVVQFYQDDRLLCDSVADFIAVGLAAGETDIIIAAEAHREAFCERLDARAFDVDRARRGGRLTLLDARETLAKFMVDGMPDWDRFHAVVGPVLAASSAAASGQVRAYGEMVNLLWQEGRTLAAIQLEEPRDGARQRPGRTGDLAGQES